MTSAQGAILKEHFGLDEEPDLNTTYTLPIDAFIAFIKAGEQRA